MIMMNQNLTSRLLSTYFLMSQAKNTGRPPTTTLILSSKWAFKKIDKALDAAAVAAGTGGVAWTGAHYNQSLQHAFEAVVNWLDIVTKGGGPF
jgi:hypothetical protein